MQDAFLSEIRDHPDDPVRKLIYADWLEDRGQLIEAECWRRVTQWIVENAPPEGVTLELAFREGVRMVQGAFREFPIMAQESRYFTPGHKEEHAIEFKVYKRNGRRYSEAVTIDSRSWAEGLRLLEEQLKRMGSSRRQRNIRP